MELIRDFEFIFNISDDDPISYARVIDKEPEGCLYTIAFTIVIFIALLIYVFAFA